MSKTNSQNLILNSRGQFVLESVLLMVLMLGLFMYGTKLVKDANLISTLVDGPWSKTSSMIENGTWDSTVQAGRKNHPNTGKRGRIFDPNG